MRRVAALTCVLSLAIGVAAAQACNEPKASFNPGEARAGQTVRFTIVNTDAGASYTVKIDGRVVASGADADGGGVSGSFAMPDLGGARRSVTVLSEVTHNATDDVHASSPWKHVATMTYLVAGPAAAPAAPAGKPAAADPAPKTATPPARAPAPRARRGDRDGRAAARARGRRADASVPAASAAPGAAEGSGRPAAATAREPVRGAQAASPKARTGARRAAAVAPSPRGSEPVVRTAAPPEAAPVGVALVGAALLVLAGMAGAVVVVLRRRGTPPAEGPEPAVPPWVPPDVELEARARDILIEAELWRIIEAERAREVTTAGGEGVAEDELDPVG